MVSEIPETRGQKRLPVSKNLSRTVRALGVAVLSVLVAAVPAVEALDLMKVYPESGYKAYSRGDWHLAARYFWYAAREILRRRGESYRYPSCLVYLGKISLKEGKIDK